MHVCVCQINYGHFIESQNLETIRDFWNVSNPDFSKETTMPNIERSWSSSKIKFVSELKKLSLLWKAGIGQRP